jgi:diguanylate cyclase (GGDEF)-like protein/PAS domain S-box-containing protein
MTLRAEESADGRLADRLSALLALHEAALDTMAHGLCVFDAEWRIALFNRRYLEIFNLSAEVIRPGLSYRAMLAHSCERGNLTSDVLEEFWHERRDTMLRGDAFSVCRKLPSGTIVAMRYEPLPDGGWVSVYEDVTEQQRLESELRVQVERLDRAVSNMSHGLSLFGPDERLVVCNEQYVRTYGLDPAVVKPGISYRDLLAHAIALGRHGDMTVDELYAERMERIRRRTAVMQRITLSDGRVIETALRPVGDGGWVSAHEDITVRLRNEETLRDQNLLFDAAIENMAHGLCVFDKDLRVIAHNKRLLEMYRFETGMLRPGTTMLQILGHAIDCGNYVNVTPEKLLADVKPYLFDNQDSVVRRELADGRIFALRFRPIANGGWVATFEDITAHEKAAQALQDQNVRFDAALNNMSQGLCMFDAEQRLIVSNEQYIKIFDADRNFIKPGVTLREIFTDGVRRGLHSETVEQLMARRVALLAEKQPVVYDRRLADGRTIETSICPMANGGWVGTYEDISERRKVEAERAAAVIQVREQHRRFTAALNNMSQGLCMIDAEHNVIVCNRRYLEIFGFSPDKVKPGVSMREIMGYSVALGNQREMSAGELYSNYVERLKAGRATIHRHLADGRVIKVVNEPMAEGGWVVTYEDITERHQAEQNIARMARHDALTDLPNRVLFREKMADGLARVESHIESMAVLCLDLDNFKTINDTLGHPIGDKLLRAVAERLCSVVGRDDTIARLGGDEFAILQCATNPYAAETLAGRLVEAVSTPIVVDGQEINTGISVGIAVAPNDGTEADHLMKCADLALYRAKAEGRGLFRFFEPDMDARIQARRALEIDLRRALPSGEFHIVYQPQLNLAANALTGMEALLRWSHPERGLVAPSDFIPVAEETGLIVPLGEWVLRRACAEAARWPDPIKVAVNLSPVQFRNRSLVATVTHALAAAGLPAARLEIEITEAALLQDDEMTVAMLHQLRSLGVRISMDDFGTGYSSLSYLRSFPFDKIKIDRSFIVDIERNGDSAAIIRAIAELGSSLGIETTAEGIETPEQLELVRRAGCTEVQGFLLSAPCAAAGVLDLIARFRRDAAAA